jgi:lysozyme
MATWPKDTTAAKKGLAGTAAAITLALALIKPWEGLWLVAKVDKIGTGRPVTACYGETKGVTLGQRFTKEQCDEMLAKRLPQYANAIAPCIHVNISDKTRAALVSFAYNVGPAAACRSTAFKRINAGNIRGGCDALMNWTMAQGKFVQGLANRRAAERRLCIEGINDGR